jgi:hypothetical protein
MTDENSRASLTEQAASPDAAAMATPEFCPRDGSILVEGVRYGYPAWVCPSCTYWKLKST